jgi:hypothetical protein
VGKAVKFRKIHISAGMQINMQYLPLYGGVKSALKQALTEFSIRRVPEISPSKIVISKKLQ